MRFEDIEKIKQLKYRYVRAIDTANEDELRDIFTEEASVHYIGATYDFEQSGRDEIVDSLMNAFHNQAVSQHMLHHPVIKFTSATEATGQWTLQDVFYNLALSIRTSGTAEYKDRYVLTEAGWKIAHAAYQRTTEFIDPISPDTDFTFAHLAKHGRPAPDT
jgi:hypothetical protein